jgi:hypothetical protein
MPPPVIKEERADGFRGSFTSARGPVAGSTPAHQVLRHFD